MNSKYLLFLLLIAMGFSACNKNQRKVRNIDGKWDVTYVEYKNYGGYDNPGIVFNFNSCKLKKKGYCDMWEDDYFIGKSEGVYNVTHDGKQLNMTIDYGDKLQPYSFKITKLSDDKCVLDNLNAEDFTYSRIEMTKQE